MLSNFIKLFTAGFIMGWGPCLTYTAPLLLPYIGATKRNWQDGLKVSFMFSIGRLAALAILGGLATIAFRLINQYFPPHRSGWLYLIIALFMIGTGILIISGKKVSIHIGKELLNKSIESMLIIGFLMGLAPCAPYVAILTYIACIAENKIFVGILYATIFAAGTAIAPLVLGTLMGIISEKLLKSATLLKIFRIICGTVLVLFGLHLLYYVLNQII